MTLFTEGLEPAPPKGFNGGALKSHDITPVFPRTLPLHTFGCQLAYALVESASQALEINRDDVGATLAYLKGRPVMVLFDAVPGGAGITKQILTNFPQVVKSAI